MNLFDQFLATQGRMAANDAQATDNKLTLAKIGQIERAQKMQDDTLATYRADAQSKTTLANLSEMRDVPDATLESQGKVAQESVTPPPKMKSAAEQVMGSAGEADRLAKIFDTKNPAEAARLRKERDDLWLKAAPLLKEERLAKIEESNAVNQWMGAVKDDVSLNAVMGQMRKQYPDMYKSWLEMKLPNGAPALPQNLDGSLAYTPQTKQIAEAVSNASMKRSEQLQTEDRVADNKQKELEFEQKKRMDEETIRSNKAKEAAAREKNAIDREELKVRTEKKTDDLGNNMTPDAMDAAAARYNLDGSLPPNIGRGNQGAALTAKILSKAAEQAKAAGDEPEAGRIKQLANKASAQALGQLSKQEAMVGAFEKNAIRNADIALDMSKKVDRTGVPIFNKWLMAGRKNIAGDAEVSKFHAATTTFVNEYAKIMSGSMGNTVVSDSLRKETETLLSTKDTQEQFDATVGLLKQEMANRMKGFKDQKAELTGNMKRRASDVAPIATYTETRVLPDGRTIGRKADGTLEIVK